MKRRTLALSLMLLCASPRALISQNYLIQRISFAGDPGVADAVLAKIAAIAPGKAVTESELNGAAQRLLDTGAFDDVHFSLHGGELSFSLTPASGLYTVTLDNLPLQAGPELDAKLRAAVPLYHGLVPRRGAMLDAVRRALEEQVDALGVSATVIAHASATSEAKMYFAVSSPTMRVGDIHVTGGVAAINQSVSRELDRITGTAFDTAGTPDAVDVALANAYRERGYLQVKVSAMPRTSAPTSPLSVDEGGAHVPMDASVDEGIVYRFRAATMAPGLPVGQQVLDQQTELHTGDVATQSRLNALWQFVAIAFHNDGYLRAELDPVAEYDRDRAQVSYVIHARPGLQYHMGKLNLDNANNELKAALSNAWPLAPGAVFNEGAIRSMMATHGVHPELERYLATVNAVYKYDYNDEASVVDVTLHLERKNP